MKDNPLQVLVVDDEKPARDRIQSMLGEGSDPKAQIVGATGTGKKAIQLVNECEPDVILLDIQMPGLSGFDVAEMLPANGPTIIFVTAYDEFALQAFEVHAVDYLLKPVKQKRLQKALDKATQFGEGQNSKVQKLLNNHSSLQRIGARYQNEIHMLDVEDVLWFEADGPLVYATTKDFKYRSDFALDQLEFKLKDRFFRIHRSFLVNLNRVKKLIPWFNYSYKLQIEDGSELKVARRRVGDLKEQLKI